MTHRTEKDSLGELQIPKDAYYGTTTTRALENFQISDRQAPTIFRISLTQIKLAAAYTNYELGLLTKEEHDAMVQACQEIIAGQFNDNLTLDAFQAGAGTSYNMNVNEIVANRANEILGHEKGSYAVIHPNNQVNMAQSTNDTIPTATRLAILQSWPALKLELEATIATLKRLAEQEQNTLKVGRTHLQDAVPITLGQEFDSYALALENSLENLQTVLPQLKKLGIGGTAVGTGLNTDPEYQEKMVTKLGELISEDLIAMTNNTVSANDMAPFSNFNAALRSLATNLINISEDLKLMSSGPIAGLAELELPAVQPGSSIMPGKINPSILECLDMICMQVCGNDTTVSLAAQRSHFELNVYCPLIMVATIESMTILQNGLKMTNDFCLKDLKVNHDNIAKTYDASICTATALAPYLGYAKTAEIVKGALRNQRSVKEEILSTDSMPADKLEQILAVERLTRPAKQID